MGRKPSIIGRLGRGKGSDSEKETMGFKWA